MREIELRGKRSDNEWLYGFYYNSSETEIDPKHYIICYREGDSALTTWLVNPETVGQYIGIKDIHKKKVFQGDIVKVKRFIFKDCRREEIEGMEEYIGEVVWHQFGWHVAEKIEDGIRYHSLWLWNIKDDESDPDTHFMEILGNKWDNLEMKVI